jgi:hypothetical protein
MWMKGFIKPKLVFAIVTAVILASAIAVPFSLGSVNPSHAASSATNHIDLEVLSIESLVRPLCAGSSPTFRAFIQNNSSIASGGFDIQWIVDGNNIYGGHYSIPADAIDTHDHIWQNLTSGQHTLTFIANFDHRINETKYNNNQMTITFTVNDCASADVAFLAPFNNGVTFTAIQGYYNNTGSCNIKTGPDHCDNQLFGLDLQPDASDNRQILAPVGGKVSWIDVGQKNSSGCMGITIDDSLNLNICHFLALNVAVGDRVARGKVLGTRSTGWVHISLDDRVPNSLCNGCLPIPFNGPHTLEGMSLNPDHNNTGMPVNYSKHWFLVEYEEWKGLPGTSNNVAIP